MSDEIKEFIVNFFKDLDSEIQDRGNYIEINKVPFSFQKFYGKNCPYYFCFKKSAISGSNEIEFIEKGNYLLKSIRSFLDNSAKNTLLKINLEDNFSPSKFISKIKFLNSTPSVSNFRKSYSFFMRFIFHNSFQYLNKKEKIIEEIFVHNKEIVKGDLNEYKLEEGNPKEVSIPDIKEDYLLAKKELNERINPKINSISKLLERHLEKEIDRIEKHTEKEITELKLNIKKNEEKIESLKKQNENTERHEKILKNLQREIKNTDFEKEKEHQISIEKSRTSLNINSKLFNTTIIYYPIYLKKIEIQNEFSKASTTFEFDPLMHITSDIKCSTCEKPSEEIALCFNGHISCKECVLECQACNKIFCKSCLKKKCELCGKSICNNCSERCSKCGKIVCKSHTKKDSSTGKTFCSNCLKRCERCSEFKFPDCFIKSKKTNVKICQSCYQKEVKEITSKSIFKS